MPLTDQETADQARFMTAVVKALDRMGTTQVELAEAIGVSPGLLRQWRNGTRRLPAHRVPGIAAFVGEAVESLCPNWSAAPVQRARVGRPATADRVADLEDTVEEQGQTIHVLRAQVDALIAWARETEHTREAGFTEIEALVAERLGDSPASALRRAAESAALRREQGGERPPADPRAAEG
jgi:DNA-binding transcriptional regulator YdaS (Cro superfamily)